MKAITLEKPSQTLPDLDNLTWDINTFNVKTESRKIIEEMLRPIHIDAESDREFNARLKL
jgi:hypothetical protein